MFEIQIHSFLLMATEVVCFWGIAPFFISEVAEIIEKSTWPQVMTLLIVLY